MHARTIIIADDATFLTQLLSLPIQNSGAEVLIARSGAELCKLATKKHPDLIITDSQKPLDGMSACAKLKQNPTTADIPILMLNAAGHQLTAEELGGANIRSVLQKPFNVRDVITQIDQILRPSLGSPVQTGRA
jgi:CheY-like chemotaxis protein